ncbi:MAG: tetratricopeptide repeat protein [Bacteroidales bacterium]|nr:tetratricopeptide repeat protein [Bacteroidales bacterium]
MSKRLQHIIVVALGLLLLLPPAVRAQDNPRAESYMVSILEQYNAQKYDAVIKMCRSLIGSCPDNDAAYFYMGMSQIATGDKDGAEENLSRAVELDPSNFWYRYRLAQYYAYTSRPELTTAMYEDLIKDFPKKTDLYYELIDLYMRGKRTEEALEVLDKIETLYGKSEMSVRSRYALLLDGGKQDEGLALLRDFADEESSAWAFSVLGDAAAMDYDDSTALACYGKAMAVEPEYAPALIGRAEIYRTTRQYTLFFEDLDSFAKVEEVNIKAKTDYFQNLVKALDARTVKNYKPQIDLIYDDLVATHPQDSLCLITAGLYYYKIGENERSKALLKENADLYPDEVKNVGPYLEVLYYTEDWETLGKEALARYEAHPSEPSYLSLAILSAYGKKDYEGLLELHKRQLKDFPGDRKMSLEALSGMGDAYHLLGNQSSAYKCYKQALKKDPGYAPVLNNYAYYLSEEGKKLRKACTMSRKTVEAEPDNATYLDTYGWLLHLLGRDEEAKPQFKHAMLYGGNESAVILDHYAEVLYSLGEYERAFVYWGQAIARNTEGEIPMLEEKIEARKAAVKKK